MSALSHHSPVAPDVRRGTRESASAPGQGRALQRELPLSLPASKPLVHLRTAMDLLDRDEDAILNLILDGQIAYAFDISTRHADRREIRIFRKSLESYKSHSSHQSYSVPSVNSVAKTLESVISEILPPGQHFAATSLKRRFTCNSGHVLHLIDEKLLLAVSDPKRGPKGSPLITRESAAAFLNSRRIL